MSAPGKRNAGGQAGVPVELSQPLLPKNNLLRAGEQPCIPVLVAGQIIAARDELDRALSYVLGGQLSDVERSLRIARALIRDAMLRVEYEAVERTS